MDPSISLHDDACGHQRVSDSCGLADSVVRVQVYSLSAPLTQGKVSPFYMSTYKTDFLLVEDKDADATLKILKSKFEFV